MMNLKIFFLYNKNFYVIANTFVFVLKINKFGGEKLAIVDRTSRKQWNIVANNKFIVTIGPILTSFQRVSGIGRSVEYDSKIEGGVNDFVHVVRKNIQAQNNILTLEKGVGKYNPLVLAANGSIEMGVRIPLPGTIIILNDNYQMSSMYTFNDIVILKWELNDLDAKGNDILIDRIELMHSGLKQVSIE